MLCPHRVYDRQGGRGLDLEIARSDFPLRTIVCFFRAPFLTPWFALTPMGIETNKFLETFSDGVCCFCLVCQCPIGWMNPPASTCQARIVVLLTGLRRFAREPQVCTKGTPYTELQKILQSFETLIGDLDLRRLGRIPSFFVAAARNIRHPGNRPMTKN